MCALSQSFEQGLIPLILSLQNNIIFHLILKIQAKQIINMNSKWLNEFA